MGDRTGRDVIIPGSSRTSSSSAALNAYIPRNASQNAGQSPETRKTTMEERLYKMRIEDRRRVINEQSRSSSSSSRSTLNARAPAFQPYSQSASARAGTLYYASSSLKEKDVERLQRERALRRKFAGPAPPTSWTPEENDEAGGENGGMAEEVDSGRVISDIHHRNRATAALRRFFLHDEKKIVKKPLSLVDSCLCMISSHLSTTHDEDELSMSVHSIPLHLKERLFALSGRLRKAPELSERIVEALFSLESFQDDASATYLDNGREQSEEYDELPEAWDSQSTEDAEGTRDRSSVHHIDLSYARISSRAAKTLLLRSSIRAENIVALSLAGWGSTGQSSLRSSIGLVIALDKLSNLRCLSLAGSQLLGEGKAFEKGESEQTHASHHAVSEAIAFLKKLSRRTVKLQTLDLSFCSWIDGAVMANLGWYSTSKPVRRLAWPSLQRLILTGCPALMPENQTFDDNAAVNFVESPSFVGTWHGAHHGVAMFTQSPFFLSHRPGLGRAVLAEGIGAWDSASGRGNLVERQAAALTNHRRSANARRLDRAPSAFDDQDDDTNGSFAISHGIAPFASRQVRSLPAHAGSEANSRLSDDLKPRCPVTTSRVERHEWERARVLDAVRGRWGSAILGDVEDESSSKRGRGGTYTTVYF